MAANVSNRVKPDSSLSSDQESSSGKKGTHPLDDLIDYAVAYSREKPEIAALWCLGIGFVLGWKLKPW